MKIDPKQIAKMITEDPDEINPLDNIEDEYAENNFVIYGENVINELFLPLVDLVDARQIHTHFSLARYPNDPYVSAGPIGLMRKLGIWGFYGDKTKKYIGNVNPGELDRDPDSPNYIFLDAEEICDKNGDWINLEEILNDYWYEIVMAFNEYSSDWVLEGPHSSGMDFVAIQTNNTANDNPLGHAISEVIYNAI
jgi:hypothetical protein